MSPVPVPKVLHHRAGPLHVEIIVVGREILRGSVADANGPWIAAALARRGALVHRITVLDDAEKPVSQAVSDGLSRGAHLIVTTGGLGPTSDDVTLAAVSDALRLPLTPNPPAREMVEAAYRRFQGEGKVRSPAMTAPREKQAVLPVGSEAIANPAGTAPGVLIRLTGGGAVLCLPGIPAEMQATYENALTRLGDLVPRGVWAVREVEAPTADESALRTILDRVAAEYPWVWVKSHPPGFRAKKANVRVTLEAVAPSAKEADHLVDGALSRLLALAGAG